jgi:hypothetical protein
VELGGCEQPVNNAEEIMAKVVIEGMDLEQAKEFAHWYEGSGEQGADLWFDCNGLKAPMTDVGREGGGFMRVDEKTETVTVYCRRQ